MTTATATGRRVRRYNRCAGRRGRRRLPLLLTTTIVVLSSRGPAFYNWPLQLLSQSSYTAAFADASVDEIGADVVDVAWTKAPNATATAAEQELIHPVPSLRGTGVDNNGANEKEEDDEEGEEKNDEQSGQRQQQKPTVSLQPEVTRIESRAGASKVIGLIQMPNGSPWCGGRPTIWPVGHQTPEMPSCYWPKTKLVTSDTATGNDEDENDGGGGTWVRDNRATLARKQSDDRTNTKSGVDRHDCVALDVNGDGLPGTSVLRTIVNWIGVGREGGTKQPSFLCTLFVLLTYTHYFIRALTNSTYDRYCMHGWRGQREKRRIQVGTGAVEKHDCRVLIGLFIFVLWPAHTHRFVFSTQRAVPNSKRRGSSKNSQPRAAEVPHYGKFSVLSFQKNATKNPIDHNSQTHSFVFVITQSPRITRKLRHYKSKMDVVFVATSGIRREDGRINAHRMFVNHTPKRPWTLREYPVNAVVVGDVNADGADDLIVMEREGNAQMYVQNKKTGKWGRPGLVSLVSRPKMLKDWRNARVGFVTRQQLPDLVVVTGSWLDVQNSGNGGVPRDGYWLRIFQGTKDPPYFQFDKPYYSLQLPYAAPDIELVDANQDGMPDIYVLQTDETRGYCAARKGDQAEYWGGKSPNPPVQWTPPLDAAPDFLLLGAEGMNGRVGFRKVLINYRGNGCGNIAERFGGNTTLLVSRGRQLHNGYTYLLKWN